MGQRTLFYAECIDALAAGAKAFHVDIYGEDVSYLARPYPELSRNMVVEKVDTQLTPDERDEVANWLRSAGLDRSFQD